MRQGLTKGAVVQINSQDREKRVGITHEVSETSVWFCSPSRFETGEHVNLRFKPDNDKTDLHLAAVVVESQSEDVRAGRLFRHRMRARLQADMSVERDDPTRPRRLNNRREIASRLQSARDNWLITPNARELRRELLLLLDVLSDD